VLNCPCSSVGDDGRTVIGAATFWSPAALGDDFGGTGRKSEECGMSIIAWIVLGLIAGFIASKMVNDTGSGLLLDIVLGVVGAIVGGFIFNAFGGVGVTGFNLYSLVVAIIGAIVVLWIYHAISGRSRTI
jgi:uncharacterized membrane protein YeaQ/YmgE (transglycosylase-associated protein family)